MTRKLFAPLHTPGLAVVLAATLVLGACAGAGFGRPPRAQQWYERALAEFRAVDIDAAHDSARHALDIVPEDEEVRILAARVALARLEHDEVLRLLKGLEGATVNGLRGRAYWYKGDLNRAADELEQLLADPEVNDAWAKEIVKLARRGQGRKPFSISSVEGRVAPIQMARVAAGPPVFVVPVEIDGDEALALISTGQPEVMVDRATRGEPGWISLRFGQRIEVKDVPALTEDLTALSHQIGAPIKALLGSNLLRHLNCTLDFKGRQFVARSFVPPPPPVASRVDLFYPRGGAMVLGSALGGESVRRASLYVDSSMAHTVALDQGGWRKIGIDPSTLKMNGASSGQRVRSGTIPMLQFGAFKLPKIPAIYGAPLDKLEKELKIDIDGSVGAGLLASFRLTLSDGGRVLWVEQQGDPPPPPNNNILNQPPPPALLPQPGGPLPQPSEEGFPSVLPGAPKAP